MQVDIIKEDLVSLICGKKPSPIQMDHPLIKRCGLDCGTWFWHRYTLLNLPEALLVSLYNNIKNNE